MVPQPQGNAHVAGAASKHTPSALPAVDASINTMPPPGPVSPTLAAHFTSVATNSVVAVTSGGTVVSLRTVVEVSPTTVVAVSPGTVVAGEAVVVVSSVPDAVGRGGNGMESPVGFNLSTYSIAPGSVD